MGYNMIQDTLGFKVQIASRDDCLAMLATPAILESFGLNTSTELPAYLDSYADTFYKLSYTKYRLIFTYFERSAGVYEIHLACPQDSTRASRLLSLYIIYWMFRDSGLNPIALTTNCPEGKIANMLRKMGTTELKTINNLVYFTVTAEQFNLYKQAA